MTPLTQEQRELAEANRGLAWMVANRFHHREQGENARQELGAIALLALCQAAQGYDKHRGYEFSTYAIMACTQAIQDERRSGGLIHTPCYLSYHNKIGHRYRVHRDHVRDARFMSAPLADMVDSTFSPIEQAKASELRDRVRRLPYVLRYVMERAIEGWTGKEIGQAMGCTGQHASNLIAAAPASLQVEDGEVNLGDIQLLQGYVAGSTGLLVNDLTGILRELVIVPTRVIIYSRANLSIFTTYLIDEIGGSHIQLNGVISGVDRNYNAGDLVHLQISVDDTPGVFVASTFTAFAITGQTTPLEVGATIAAGSKTFTWSTSNSTSVKPNSISIVDTTASVTLDTGLANTGSDAITITAITNTVAADQVWTINGTDTQNAAFSRTYTVDWYWRVYAGTSANLTLTANQIKALADSSDLQAGFAGTYDFSAGDYKYFCYPDSLGSVANFVDANTGFPISMATVADDAAYSHTANGWSYALVSVINAQSIATNYRVYRSQYPLGGTLSVRVT